MARFKEGDRVKITVRDSNDQDRKINMFFQHMVGLTGTVQNYYNAKEIAVKVDLDKLPDVQKKVHDEATRRLRAKFVDSVGEEQRKSLTKEELEFTPHYMLLLSETDLEKM